MLLGRTRERVLRAFTQPLTVRQVGQRVDLDIDQASEHVVGLASRVWTRCLNDHARRGRVYGLTREGVRVRHRLSPERPYREPDLDWALYGWVSFSHRAAMLRAMEGTVQPVQVRRRARFLDSELRMSGNNARDVMHLFLAKGIVQRVPVRKGHPRYELTPLGRALQEALVQGESPQ